MVKKTYSDIYSQLNGMLKALDFFHFFHGFYQNSRIKGPYIKCYKCSKQNVCKLYVDQMLEMIFFYNCIDLIRFWRIKTGGDFGF